jgi:neopullulanase
MKFGRCHSRKNATARRLAAAWRGLVAPLFEGPPIVSKVEPPNWWVGHSNNPVRVMLTGKSLYGARVELSGGGASLSNLSISRSGDYLWIDVVVDPGAEPGSRVLRVTTGKGAAEAAFALLAPLPREGRFQGFSPDDLVYLIMPDRFSNGDPANDESPEARALLDRGNPRHYHGGDLQGVIDRLGYLKDLGVTAIWLTPWYDNVNHVKQRPSGGGSSTDYHGYGAVDFYAVEERFGTLEKLQELVRTAQGHGIKVIQDQVANHTGFHHSWVRNPPTPTWFNGTPEDHLVNRLQIWPAAHPNPPEEALRETLEGWFMGLLPDLNQNDPDVAIYLIQNALWWVGITGLDAIRQDTMPYVPRTFWAEWTRALKKEYPRLITLGEVWERNPEVVAFFQGGRARFDGVDTGVDSLFDFPLFYTVREVFIRGAPMTSIPERLASDFLYVDPKLLVTFLGLHDVERFMHEPGATAEGLMLALTFLLTTRGVPLVYYGDEIGMRGGRDPDNRRTFPGGFPGDGRNAFEEAGRSPEEQVIFSHLRKIARLRAELEPLRRGELVHLAATDSTYSFARQTPGSSALIIFNNSPEPEEMIVDIAALCLPDGTTLRDCLDGVAEAQVESGKVKLLLQPRSSMIFAPVRCERESISRGTALPETSISSTVTLLASPARGT